MIRLGLRLAVSGGREAVIRLVIVAAAVALGVGLLLAAVAGTNAVNAQNDRYAWLDTQPQQAATSGRDPLWGRVVADRYAGQAITRVDVAATGPTSPVPPGIPRLPGPGQYYVSPALGQLLRSTPADQLGARFPGHEIGVIGNAALPSPGTLMIIIGRTPAQLADLPDAGKVTSINTIPPSGCDGANCSVRMGTTANSMDLILSVVALALLFPVLIFIATATRLSAARREQRYAAMRLTGATPGQISVIAAVESTLAAVLGVAGGFVLFFALRTPLAAIPFTGAPFFPGDLSLSLPDILAVAIGVPLAAAVAARLALRRVRISPLGVSRRVTPKAPASWRLVPLLAGLAELGFFVVHGRPATTAGQVQAFVPGFALIMIGLVIAGPWLTMAGARLMAGRANRPGSLIAARRLADNPRAGFRAVSGLVLALFITTVAVALITTQDAKGTGPAGGTAAANVVTEQFDLGDPGQQQAPAPSPATLARLHAIDGVQGLLEVRAVPGLTIPGALVGFGQGTLPAGAVPCRQLATIPAFGRCPTGAAAAALPIFELYRISLAKITWPAAHIPAQQLSSLPLASLFVPTNGSVAAIEQVRTILENTYPAAVSQPVTLSEVTVQQNGDDLAYQHLAEVVILTSLPIAGCTLAASITAGLADRKRPFSLLRLAGAPLGMLRRAVALESAVPLLAVAAVSIGLGFAASAMFVVMQIGHTLVAPGGAYYLMTVAGIALSLGIIAATFPLLRRITGPETARNE